MLILLGIITVMFPFFAVVDVVVFWWSFLTVGGVGGMGGVGGGGGGVRCRGLSLWREPCRHL